MKNWINTYLSNSYMLGVNTATKYELFYLVASGLLISFAGIFRLFIFIKGNRPKAYKTFDSFTFWGLLSLGIFGLFIYFSRTQELPIFSTRLISYLWIIGLVGYVGGLVYYLKKKLPSKVEKYYESKRKAKYLKR